MQPPPDSCQIFAKSLRRTCLTSLPNFRACKLGKLVLMLREISSQDRLCGATSLWTSIAVSTKYQSAFLKVQEFSNFHRKKLRIPE